MSDHGPAPDSVTRFRVMLVADVRLYRDGLMRALEGSLHIEVVGSAPVSAAAIDLLERTQPDIVLLEVAAARVPAIVHSILSAASQTKVVAFAIADEELDPIRCAEAGAAGYVSKEASIEDLVGTIVRVARGEFPCSPRVASLLARRISFLAAQGVARDVRSSLTMREREIVRLIDEGFSNKEIAQRLGIVVSTVKNHVHHILEKTHVCRRAQAAARLRTWAPQLQEGGALPRKG